MSETHPFTCITCRIAFKDGDAQRYHYRTDWHRYNLKRKVAELPPVNEDSFNEKVLAKKAAGAAESEEKGVYCPACKKRYNSRNAHTAHLETKRHKQLAAELEREELQQSLVEGEEEKKDEAVTEKKQEKEKKEEEMDTDSEGEESWDEDGALGLEECLFCSRVSGDLEGNLRHMSAAHSFFLPHAEFIGDMEGLIAHLDEKVGVGHMCLWCGDRSKLFRTVRAAQQHMVDLGHCKLLYDGDAVLEYSDFYDYSSSYPDQAEGQDVDVAMETDDDVVGIDDSGFQLTLPSGATVGHRSLRHIYKQNLKPERVARKTSGGLLQHYKAIGWTGTSGEHARVAAKDLAFVSRMRAKHDTRLKIKANKFQPHLRPQVIF